MKSYSNFRKTHTNIFLSRSRDLLEFFFLPRSNKEKNLWSLHTNWWSCNSTRVLRWCTGKITAIILKILRPNTEQIRILKKRVLRMKIYRDWRKYWKHLNIRITPQSFYSFKPNRNFNWISFFWPIEEGITCHENNLKRKKTHLFNTKKISQEELVLQRNDKNLSAWVEWKQKLGFYKECLTKNIPLQVMSII